MSIYRVENEFESIPKHHLERIVARGCRSSEKRRFQVYYENRAFESDDSGNFRYLIPNGGISGFDTMEVMWLTIPNTIYNVTDFNNEIYVEESGGPTATVTLTNGMYDAESLGEHIAAVLTADGTLARTYSSSFSSDTFKITLSVDSGTFLIDQRNLNNPVLYTAGLTKTSQLNSTSLSLEFPNAVSVTPTAVQFEIVETGYKIHVPFDATLGSFSITRSNFRGNFERFVGRDRAISTITIRIYDAFNRIVYLQGAPISCEIEAWDSHPY